MRPVPASPRAESRSLLAGRGPTRVRYRPAYHPATLLKIYLYGHLNRAQSSRRLERETQRNLELRWLTGRLIPTARKTDPSAPYHGFDWQSEGRLSHGSMSWAVGMTPDFKTIADFRKDNGPAIRATCRQFVLLCRKLDPFSVGGAPQGAWEPWAGQAPQLSR
jgi:transposase